MQPTSPPPSFGELTTPPRFPGEPSALLWRAHNPSALPRRALRPPPASPLPRPRLLLCLLRPCRRRPGRYVPVYRYRWPSGIPPGIGLANLASRSHSDSFTVVPKLPYIARFMAGLVGVRINTSRPNCLSSRAVSTPVSYQLTRAFFRPSFRPMQHQKPDVLVARSLEVSKGNASANIGKLPPSKEVLEIWQSADAVCFDVDSTVCLDEGIDELADFCGAGKAVAEWTAKAMGGSVPFEEALAARLSLFKPSLSQVRDCLETRPPRISPGIAELIQKLKDNDTDVYLVSGGFRQMIEPVALKLGIPPENIFANQLLFASSGEFIGFNTSEPTSRSGGKAVAVQHIRKVHGYDILVMIGDGATDLEARKPGGADLFICYAGVQMREAVAAKADWVVLNFQELLAHLPL